MLYSEHCGLESKIADTILCLFISPTRLYLVVPELCAVMSRRCAPQTLLASAVCRMAKANTMLVQASLALLLLLLMPAAAASCCCCGRCLLLP